MEAVGGLPAGMEQPWHPQTEANSTQRTDNEKGLTEPHLDQTGTIRKFSTEFHLETRVAVPIADGNEL
jgi:hypothetical protein